MRTTVFGQDRAIDLLQRAVRSGRLHHAWLFAGPPGVGKRTAAVALAKVLLNPDLTDELRGELRVDPDAPAVRRIVAGTHADYHFIYKELALFSDNAVLRERKLSNIPLDLLRERMLGGKTGDDRQHDAAAYRTAVEGHGKVFIIDEAELIDATGQNALLKTLEEPPPQTYIILVTARPEALLPTVLSRCQLVRFAPLDATSMRKWMERSDQEIDPADAEWILSFADGSPGTAQIAAAYGIAGWRRTLAPALSDLHQGRFNTDFGAAMAKLVDDFAQTWVKRHDQASKLAANRLGAQMLFSLLSHDARERLADAMTRGRDASIALETIDRVRDAESQLASNVNMKHVFENLAAQCVA